jgi:hypothetical protein
VIEANLSQVQQELIALELIALQKTQDALKVVTSTARTSSDSPTRAHLITLEEILEKTKTKDDHPKLKWPRIPDTTKADNGFYMKVRAQKAKTKKYKNIDYNIKKNKTKIQTTFNGLSKSVTSSRTKRAASPAVNDVLLATSDVLNKYTEYGLKIATALTQVAGIFPINTTPCFKLMNISDSKGSYLKSACLIQTPLNFQSAQSRCQANNMPNLYSITNADDYQGIKNFAHQISMQLFNSTLQKIYTINGFQQSDVRWFNRNPLVTPYAASAVPQHQLCLYIEGSTGVANFKGFPCGRDSHMFCEYNKTTQTPTNCVNPVDINTSGGAYIKTICTHKMGYDAITNHQSCKNNGMTGAYTMTRAEEVTAVKNYFPSVSVGSFTLTGYQIGGILSPKNIWYYPDGQTFFLSKILRKFLNYFSIFDQIYFSYFELIRSWMCVHSRFFLMDL